MKRLFLILSIPISSCFATGGNIIGFADGTVITSAIMLSTNIPSMAGMNDSTATLTNLIAGATTSLQSQINQIPSTAIARVDIQGMPWTAFSTNVVASVSDIQGKAFVVFSTGIEGSVKDIAGKSLIFFATNTSGLASFSYVAFPTNTVGMSATPYVAVATNIVGIAALPYVSFATNVASVVSDIAGKAHTEFSSNTTGLAAFPYVSFASNTIGISAMPHVDFASNTIGIGAMPYVSFSSNLASNLTISSFTATSAIATSSLNFTATPIGIFQTNVGWQLIASTFPIGDVSTMTITFSSIAIGHLIVFSSGTRAEQSGAANNADIVIRFNADDNTQKNYHVTRSTSYVFAGAAAAGAVAYTSRGSSANAQGILTLGTSTGAPVNMNLYFDNFSSDAVKTGDYSATIIPIAPTSPYLVQGSWVWYNTTTITEVDVMLFPRGTKFRKGSFVTLFGQKIY